MAVIPMMGWVNLKEAAVFQVILYDNVSDCVEHKLDVIGVCCASKVRVDLFLVLTPVQILEFHLNVGRSVVICVGSFVFWETH